MLISKQVVVFCFLIWNMLDQAIKNYPKDINKNGSFSQKFEINKNYEKLWYVSYIETV